MFVTKAVINHFKRSFSVVSETPNFRIKTITIPSISNRHKIPIPYQLTYLDTARESDKQRKIALLLHGTPGSCQDFHLQIPFLNKNGIRVLSPNFPEYKYVRETKGLYRHSPQDRADFVKAFLNEIKVDKIDLLVSHSSAIYPSTILSLSDSYPKIKFTTLINPATHIVSRVVKPVLLSKVLVYLGARKWSYKILQSLAKGFLQKISPVKIKDIDHTLYALTTLMTSEFKSVEQSLTMLRDKKHPMLLIYSLNDKLFEPHIYQEMEKLLVPDKELLKELLWIYNDKGDLISEGTSRDWIKIVSLAGGTHYSMWKHPEIINDNFIEILNKID